MRRRWKWALLIIVVAIIGTYLAIYLINSFN